MERGKEKESKGSERRESDFEVIRANSRVFALTYFAPVIHCAGMQKRGVLFVVWALFGMCDERHRNANYCTSRGFAYCAILIGGGGVSAGRRLYGANNLFSKKKKSKNKISKFQIFKTRNSKNENRKIEKTKKIKFRKNKNWLLCYLPAIIILRLSCIVCVLRVTCITCTCVYVQTYTCTCAQKREILQEDYYKG